MKTICLALAAALLAFAPPAAAEPDCDVNADVCAEATSEGACVLVWAATHAYGPCVSVDDPVASAVCTLKNQCIMPPGDCDTGGDICLDATSDGACAAMWFSTHPLGGCVFAGLKPTVTVCTFTPPCRGI